ncbi:MAG: OB-fold domain-containing protein, partial [Nitrososphaeria archaeon]
VIDLPREGTILTYTIVYSAPEGFGDFAPYAVAIVELTNGAKLMLQIVDTDFEKIQIGKKINVVFRRLFVEGKAGIIIYGPKARVED